MPITLYRLTHSPSNFQSEHKLIQKISYRPSEIDKILRSLPAGNSDIKALIRIHLLRDVNAVLVVYFNYRFIQKEGWSSEAAWRNIIWFIITCRTF